MTSTAKADDRLARIEARNERIERALVSLIDHLPTVGDDLAAIREDVAKQASAKGGKK